MKRLAYILTLACLTILSACSGSNDKGGGTGGGGGGGGKVYTLSITSGSSSTVASAGGTATISFTTNDKWTASCTGSWCTLSSTSGSSGSNSITVEVNPNDSYDERNTSVTISCGTKSAKATITQKQLDAILISSDKIEVDYNGGSAEITVQSNINYSWSVTSGEEWIKEGTPTKGLKSSTIYLDIEDNWDKEVRQGEITITGGGKTEKVNVYQQASTPRIVISDPEIEVGSGAQDIKVELKSNCDYDIQMPEVDWIKQKDTKAASTYTLEFSIEENTTYDNRSAEIKILNKETSETETISVSQCQKDAIVIAKSTYEVSPAGGALSFKVNSNVEFKTDIDVDWIEKVEPTKGLVEVPLSFNIKAYDGYEYRSGHITLSYGEIKQDITVTQAQNNVIILSTKTFDLTNEAQKITVKLQANSEYEIQMPAADWISEETTKGLEEYTHVYNIKENTGYDSRTAYIIYKIKDTDIKDTVTINQAQKDAIVIGTDSYDVDYNANTIDIKVNTNVDFESSSDVDWITKVPETKGLTEKTISYAVAINNTTEERVGHITFTYGDIEQKVTVTQAGNDNISTAKLTHSEKIFTIPEIGDIISGTVDWGDGKTEPYSKGLRHEYENDGEKVVTINWLGGSYFKVDKLQSISEIERFYTIKDK